MSSSTPYTPTPGFNGASTQVTPEWFDDYAIDHTIVSQLRTVSADDVRAYVRFTNDVRPVLGQSEPTVSVPQMFLFSLGVGLLLHAPGGYVPRQFVAFFGFETIDFHRTARSGDTIRSTARVTELTPRGRNGLVTYLHQTTLEDGTPLVSSVQRILVQRRNP